MNALGQLYGVDVEVETQTEDCVVHGFDDFTLADIDKCPLCGGELTMLGCVTDYDILCKCKVCGLAVFR